MPHLLDLTGKNPLLNRLSALKNSLQGTGRGIRGGVCTAHTRTFFDAPLAGDLFQ